MQGYPFSSWKAKPANQNMDKNIWYKTVGPTTKKSIRKQLHKKYEYERTMNVIP